MMDHSGLLVWFCVVTRILSTGTIPPAFQIFDPYLSFWGLGIITVLMSIVLMVLLVMSGCFSGHSVASWR